MSKPKLLDLFCGGGGAAVGYTRAGFEVYGIDNKPQPHYPFPFLQMDALEAMDRLLHGEGLTFSNGETLYLKGFDAYHASPPCQAYSISRNAPHIKTHPQLIGPVRDRLIKMGKHFVIENVVGAPLYTVFELCGATFGLKVYRHRRFETSFLCLAPSHQKHLIRCRRQGYTPNPGDFQTVTGLGHLSKAAQDYAKVAMGIDWMSPNELSEAIPPAYTEYIGKYLLQAIKREGQALQ